MCGYVVGAEGIKRKSNPVDVRTGRFQHCVPQHQLAACAVTGSCSGCGGPAERGKHTSSPGLTEISRRATMCHCWNHRSLPVPVRLTRFSSHFLPSPPISSPWFMYKVDSGWFTLLHKKKKFFSSILLTCVFVEPVFQVTFGQLISIKLITHCHSSQTVCCTTVLYIGIVVVWYLLKKWWYKMVA